MPSHTPVETAKIYQFPVGGRASLSKHTAAAHVNEAELTATPRIAVGSSWYHDAAVQEADKDQQH